MTLIEIRKRLGMTQQELAKALEMARPYLAGVEKGKYPLSKKLIKKIEDFEKLRKKYDKEYDKEKAPQIEGQEKSLTDIYNKIENCEMELKDLKDRLEAIEKLLIKILAK